MSTCPPRSPTRPLVRAVGIAIPLRIIHIVCTLRPLAPSDVRRPPTYLTRPPSLASHSTSHMHTSQS
eukprot:6168680-Prymnesium_polylepis.1